MRLDGTLAPIAVGCPPHVIPVRLDDSHVAILVRCEHVVSGKVITVRQFNDSIVARFNNVVVGHDAAIFAYEEAAALGDRVAIPGKHCYGDKRPIRFSGYRRDIEMAWVLSLDGMACNSPLR